MRVLITGAGGLLGSETLAAFEGTACVFAALHQQLDVCSRESISDGIEWFKPDWLINCAAATNVDRCERDREWADALNCKAPYLLAEECLRHKVRLLHVSTDYVFDGETSFPYQETDPTHPLSYYGQTKLCGETPVLTSGGCVVRTQWLYGRKKMGFVGHILRQKQAKVINDSTGCPTWAGDVARILTTIVHNDASGLYHVANAGSATWLEFAEEIVRLWKAGTLLKPISAMQLNLPAKRPHFSVLDCSKLANEGISPRNWHDALHEFYQKEGREL